MEDKVIKNMEYWKKKNNIPGIEALADSGLTDGRAGSSAFQMATPGSSPNKGFLGNLGQGLMGKGKMGFLNPAMWAARGVKNTLDADPTTTNVLGGGAGNQMFGGMFGPAAGSGMPQDPAMAAVPVQTPMTMKSPMKQEDPTEKIYLSRQIKLNYKKGDLVDESDFEAQFKMSGNDPEDYPQLSVQDYSEIREDENGLYVQKLKEGEEINFPASSNLPDPNAGTKSDIQGGVGETPIEMHSPNKIYGVGGGRDEDWEKY